MSRKLKLILYAVCLVGVFVLGPLTLRAYREATKASEHRVQRLERAAVNENTNAVESTNTTDTNVVAAAVPDTNTTTTATNATDTNAVVATAKDDATEAMAGSSSRGLSRMVTYGLGLLLFFIGLAVLIAYDVTQYLGQKAQQVLFNDEGAPKSAEYEQAEELAKDGKYLEAIQAMRDYLKDNPREQYVALRIAEIYEENLFNHLAAALEYEEVLTKQLPAERWGWAAIHLSNLYSGKLNQPDKAIVLLRRIDTEYGQTSAAKKARDRLTQIDPEFVPAATAAFAVSSESTSASEQSTSNLPPGFRPKS
jgi:TolA-binding protein